MGLFSKTKKPDQGEPKTKVEATRTPVSATSTTIRNVSSVLRQARITEKATMHSSIGVYTFEIAEGATKRDVIQAVRALYQVTPRKVRVVPIPTKLRRNSRTGKVGITRGGKKAYVYLKKGETITIG